MKIPCIRCGDLIKGARKGNARYITNESDVKTHRPTDVDIFEVHQEGTVIKTHKKLEDAQDDYKKEIDKVKPHLDKLKDDFKKLSDEFHAIPDLPENAAAKANKSGELLIKNNELSEKKEAMQSIRITSRSVVESKPKTGIICLKEECQDENDVIIWG